MCDDTSSGVGNLVHWVWPSYQNLSCLMLCLVFYLFLYQGWWVGETAVGLWAFK